MKCILDPAEVEVGDVEGELLEIYLEIIPIKVNIGKYYLAVTWR
jgi:hypothetical protein